MHEEMGRWPWDPFASPTKPASAGQTDASVQGGAALLVHAHGTVEEEVPPFPDQDQQWPRDFQEDRMPC